MEDEVISFLRLELAAFIGGVLGYLGIRYQAAEALSKKLTGAALSITTGMFAAWIVCAFSTHMFNLHINIGLALGGLTAFGGTDIMMALYQRLKKQIENGRKE